MARVFSVPERTYQVGTQTVGPLNVAANATLYVIHFSRDKWLDPAVKLTIRFEISLDNGVTWSPDPSGETVWPWGIFPVTMKAEGGSLVGPGGPILETVQELPIPGSGNQRDIRAFATIEGGPLTTAIAVDIS